MLLVYAVTCYLVYADIMLLVYAGMDMGMEVGRVDEPVGGGATPAYRDCSY